MSVPVTEVQAGEPVAQARMTVAEYEADPRSESHELVDGWLEEQTPMSGQAGYTAGELFAVFREHTKAHGGHAFPDGTFFACFGDDRVRKPDAAYLAPGRLDGVPFRSVTVAPSVVVEVISPTDVAWMVEKKADEYLAAGVSAVLLVHTNSRRIVVYRRGGESEVFESGQVMRLGEFDPVLEYEVDSLFADPPPEGADDETAAGGAA